MNEINDKYYKKMLDKAKFVLFISGIYFRFIS